MKKKVLFMVSSMNIGGVEKSLLSLLSVIPNDRYDITLLLLEKKGDFLEYIPDWVKVEEATWYDKIKPIIMQPPQQTIKGYYQNKEYKKIPTFIYSYLLSKQLDNRYFYYNQVFKSVSKKMDVYDVAIAYQGPTDIIDYYIANKVNAKKKISWVHFDVSNHQINKKLYKKLYDKFEKIFVVSNEAKKQLIEKIPTIDRKAEVFLNIVSNNLINNMSKKSIRFNEEYKGLKIVTVGRLSREKGQDLAITVLSLLRKEGYEVRWYCVGDGSDRKEFEMLIEQNNLRNDFILLGSTPNPYPYIDQADIYVQTSKHEGYCLTIAEAKCLQKPIVTTNFIGAYEQLEDGYNGFIVKCNAVDIYKKVKYLIDNSELRNKLTRNLAETNLDTTNEVYKLFNYIE
ncbi:glycosyltransferase [Metabacillus halosaccharovorans]|uniref:Glycosyltransferase n=1 Tax=Metabacillus halosaccharovorans TaxID=930124 RepID=A0ABT3DCV2_9BACI|nr:glycosyltransferase [Metabacillus halosaccharovorans]MCV9884799.1 glycosyltransferase [Metabacillus halosaccharovorans]